MLHSAVHLISLTPAKEISMRQYLTRIQTVYEQATKEYPKAEAAPLTFNVGDRWKSVRTRYPLNKRMGVDKICLSRESNHDSSDMQPVCQSTYHLRRPGSVPYSTHYAIRNSNGRTVQNLIIHFRRPSWSLWRAVRFIRKQWRSSTVKSSQHY
jgi:hypothetical protein